ncbi:L,D-transpeptidase [uncultured Megasphaera sp.]|uniref:L,D-transpeptidase n=1 Tax=Megasphaera sp. TaxID=2023260 RepID=UPI0028684318|nr:L,D-transpeptidase [uncultured Megasphaera sp.]
MHKRLIALTCALVLTTGAALADTPELKTAPAPFHVKVEIKPTSAPQTETQPAAAAPQTAAKTAPARAQENTSEKKIGINLASRILTLYEGDTKIKMYHVGVGKTTTPTPTGYYQVQYKEVNPTWVDPDDTSIQISSGPDNPIGYRWIGFYGNYGIHGTNHPESIGGYVSNGCVRMNEADVEDLYQYVSVGTPVNIYYDRLVIDADPDHTVSYYIYPDGYGWQSLSVAQVKKALAGYGVEDFAEFQEISDKINASDGNVTYIAKAYDLVVNGNKLSKRALGKNGQIYLPAVAVATALKLDLQWNSQQAILTSPYGIAPGYVKSDVVYMNAVDAYPLFHLKGELTPDYVYNMYSVKGDKTPTVVISPTR